MFNTEHTVYRSEHHPTYVKKEALRKLNHGGPGLLRFFEITSQDLTQPAHSYSYQNILWQHSAHL